MCTDCNNSYDEANRVIRAMEVPLSPQQAANVVRLTKCNAHRISLTDHREFWRSRASETGRKLLAGG